MNYGSRMSYDNYIKESIKSTKNIVNKMYLNEIQIFWDDLKKVLDKNKFYDTENYKSISEAVDLFSKELSNKKYYQAKSGKHGFEENDFLFSAFYLDEIINLFFERHSAFSSPSFSWGYNTFVQNMSFYAHNLREVEKNLSLNTIKSEEFLSLIQNTDIQLRAQGKKMFNKFTIRIPLLVFFTMRVLDRDEYNKIYYTTASIKSMFDGVKSLIVCEMLDSKFFVDPKKTNVDGIYVLRCQQKGNRINPINHNTLMELNKGIEDCLFERIKVDESFKKTGIIK